MAYENDQAVLVLPAAVDFTDYEGYGMKITAGEFAKCDTLGEFCYGPLAGNPGHNQNATVHMEGIRKVRWGDTVAIGDQLTVDATGRFIATTTGDHQVVGRALEVGAVGGLGAAVIYHPGAYSALTGTALSDGKILIGSAANVAAAKTPSGDATMTREGVITVTDVTVGSDATGDILYKSSATALARLGKGSNRATLRMNAAGTLPAWDNGVLVKSDFTGFTTADDPSLSEWDHTVAPGTTGAMCYAQCATGVKLGYWILGAGETILGPVGQTNSIDVACDQTDNEGLEIFSNAFCADGRPLCVGFDAAFYFLVKFQIGTINGCDDLFIGFRTRELINATMENYDTFFGLGLNTAASPGAIKVRNELNGGGADNTDTTNTIASVTDLQVKILVSANGVATCQHDAVTPGTLAAPTSTKAFTFDDGDVLVPTFRFLHANAAQAGAILIKNWEVGLQ